MTFRAHIKAKKASLKESLKTHYGHDKALLFRARNLIKTIIVADVVVLSLVAAFWLLPAGLLDQRARLIFSILLLGVVCCFSVAYVLAIRNKLGIARRIMLGFTICATVLATLLTGGFPYSVATPSLMIPVVFAYCVYGGKVSNWTAIAIPVFLIIQWISVKWLGLELPDYASYASPEANDSLVILSTFLVIIFAMVSFDLSNRRFIKQAEAAVDSKASFLANMSHEIRTPMNGVLGFSEIMRKTELSADQKTYMDAIHSSGKSLLTIINDILDFSKIEANGIELKTSFIDFRELVNEVATLFNFETKERNIEIHVDYPTHFAGTIEGDPVRLRQILMNLVGNAVKFTSEGYVSISVSEIRKSKPQRLRVEVKDTGIGIPEDRVDHIFERFTQAESSTTQKYGGTGLGLAISQKLVELMNGDIGVQSIENEGSTFWFEIETSFTSSEADVQQSGVQEPHVPASRKAAQVPQGALQKILFVTENPAFCAAAAQFSLENGYKPHLMPPTKSVAAFLNTSDFTQNWQPIVIFDDVSSAQKVQNLVENLKLNPPLLNFQIVYMSDLNGQECAHFELEAYLPKLCFAA